jgi:hypothetical protein
MSVGWRRRRAEQGQALILALVLLGLLSAFSVAILRLASASQSSLSSVRQTAYQDSQRSAGAFMARQLVVDGLGCSSSAVNAQFSNGDTISATVGKAPDACAGQQIDPDGDGGAVPGSYVVCTTVNSSGGPYHATVTVSAHPSSTGSNLTIDVVHYAFGSNSPC